MVVDVLDNEQQETADFVNAFVYNPLKSEQAKEIPRAATTARGVWRNGERNDYVDSYVNVVPDAPEQMNYVVRGFSFTGAVREGLLDTFYLENFLAPTEYNFYTGQDNKTFRERQLDLLQEHAFTVKPRGLVEHVQEFTGGMIGKTVGMLSDPVAVVGLGVLLSALPALPLPAAVAGAGFVGRTLGTAAVRGTVGGVGFGAVEQARKVAQNIEAKKKDLVPDMRPAFLEGFYGAMLGEALIVGGKFAIGGARGLMKYKQGIKWSDPSFVEDGGAAESYNGEYHHAARIQDAIFNYSDNVNKDKFGNVYDDAGTLIAEADSPAAQSVVDELPQNDVVWQSQNMRYDVALANEFDRLTGDLQIEVEERQAKRQESIEAKTREGARLEANQNLIVNEYTLARERNTQVVAERTIMLEAYEARTALLEELKTVEGLESIPVEVGGVSFLERAEFAAEGGDLSRGGKMLSPEEKATRRTILKDILDAATQALIEKRNWIFEARSRLDAQHAKRIEAAKESLGSKINRLELLKKREGKFAPGIHEVEQRTKRHLKEPQKRLKDLNKRANTIYNNYVKRKNAATKAIEDAEQRIKKLEARIDKNESTYSELQTQAGTEKQLDQLAREIDKDKVAISNTIDRRVKAEQRRAKIEETRATTEERLRVQREKIEARIEGIKSRGEERIKALTEGLERTGATTEAVRSEIDALQEATITKVNEEFESKRDARIAEDIKEYERYRSMIINRSISMLKEKFREAKLKTSPQLLEEIRKLGEDIDVAVGEGFVEAQALSEVSTSRGLTEFLGKLKDRISLLEKSIADAEKQRELLDLEEIAKMEESKANIAAVQEQIAMIQEQIANVKPVTLETMTDAYHQEATKKYVDDILKAAEASPDQLTFLKDFIDSLISAGELEKTMKYSATEPLQTLLRKYGQQALIEVAENEAMQKNAIKVFLGKRVPANELEADLAKMLQDVSNNIREMQLTFGFNIGYVDKYLPLQFKDPVAMIENGVTKEMFVEDLVKGLDWELMGFGETIDGKFVEAGVARKEEYLSRVYDEIMNRDYTRPLTDGYGHTSEFARRNKSRSFHYKDVDLMFDHMKMFSNSKNIFEALSHHVNSVANRLTQHATLGISPVDTAEILSRRLKDILESKPYTTQGWQKYYSSPFYRIESLDSVLNELAKSYSWYNEGSFMSKLYTATNFLTQARLGGIGVYAIEDITRTFLASKRFKFVVKDFFKDLFSGGQLNKESAAYLGLVLDDVRHVVPDEVHLTKSSQSARGFAEFMYKWSGSKFLVDRTKIVVAKHFYRSMAKFLEGSYSDVPVEFRTHLDKYGVGINEWNRLKRLPYTRNVQGVKLYSPRDVYKLPDRLDRQAVMRLNQAMYGFMIDGVVEAGRFRSAALWGTLPDRNTLMGFAANSLKTFTGAPTSLSYNIIGSDSPLGRVYKEAALVMMSGALMMLIRDLTKGQRPAWEDFESKDWVRYSLEAYKFGGGFGILSDWLLLPFIAGLSDRPAGATKDELNKTLVGAGLGQLASVGADMVGILDALMRLENPNIIGTAEKYIPNLPGVEILANRLLLGALKEMLDEDDVAEQRRERMQEIGKKVDIF